MVLKLATGLDTGLVLVPVDPVLLGGVVALVAASLAHELTHAAAARALGGTARIDWWSLETAYALPGDGDGGGAPRRTHYAVLLAPFGVGVAAAGLWVLVRGVPVVGLRSALYALAWGLYAFGGGLDDFRVQPVDGDDGAAPAPGGGGGSGGVDGAGGEDGAAGDGETPTHTLVGWVPSVDLAEHTSLLLWSLSAFGVGWAVHQIGSLAPVGIATYLGAAASGLFIAGTLLLGWSLVVYDRQRRGEDAILPPSGD